MKAINPANGEVIQQYPQLSFADVEKRLVAADEAFANHRVTSYGDRADKLRKVAAQLRENKDHHARLITNEMGKPITQSQSEVEKCASVCDFYADHAEQFLSPEMIDTEAAKSYVRYDPIGAVLAIMPWNFPYWQVFRFAAPAVMAGNVGLLKHASNVPGCALAIEELFRDAGFADGVFQTLLMGRGDVDRLIEHPTVAAVTLTGSEAAGSQVAAKAGEQIKKTVLELGGSDPFIVLADANPIQAAQRACRGRTINTGQSCIAAKRFIVHEDVAGEFEQAMVNTMQGYKIGDPLDPDTHIGPMAREDLLDDLHDQVKRSVDAGAKLLCGGERLDHAGYFYPPTVLANVQPGMAAFDEETFGPVAAITRVSSNDEAVELANRSTLGLGCSIATRDLDEAQRLAARINAGCVFINEIVKSDPRLPFGGVKRSGYGRELADVGIREFVNIKTIWVD